MITRPVWFEYSALAKRNLMRDMSVESLGKYGNILALFPGDSIKIIGEIRVHWRQRR